jgi:hypothetical protein
MVPSRCRSGGTMLNRQPTAASSDLTVAWLDFRDGAKVQRPLCREDVIVVDDFWHDPGGLRRHILEGAFEHRSSESGFVFHDRLAPRRHTLRMADLASRVVGDALFEGHFEGRFVYETTEDERRTREKVWVHYDRWIRIGVLYLPPPGETIGGTGFYRHRGTGFLRVQQADAAGNRVAIQGDSTDMSAWELVLHVPLRFNRLVLFDSRVFHQAIRYFGDSPSNARLYAIIAFDEPAKT